MKRNHRIALLVAVMLLCTLVLTACGGVTGTVTDVYQYIVSGPVHTYIAVELEDGSTVEVQLPDSDSVWNTARNSVGKQVTIRGSGDTWTFVDFAK